MPLSRVPDGCNPMPPANAVRETRSLHHNASIENDFSGAGFNLMITALHRMRVRTR